MAYNQPDKNSIQNHQKGRKKLIWGISLALVLVILTAAAASSWEASEEDEEEKEEKELVGVQVPDIIDMEETTSIIGQIETADRRIVIPEMSGKVEHVHVEEGDVVSPGQMLFTLEDRDYRLQLEEAQAAKRGAEAQLKEAKKGAREGELVEAESTVEMARKSKEQARRELERVEELHKEGFVSDQEIEQVEMQYENAREQLKSAEAYLDTVQEGARQEQIDALSTQVEQTETAIELAERAVDRTRVTSPAGGEVALLEAKEGQLVGTAEPAAIINAPIKQATAAVPETYVNRIAEGDRVKVEVPSLEESMVDGIISKIGSLPPEGGSSYPVEIMFEDEEVSKKLRSGMYCRAEITVASSPEALAVPRQALMREGEKYQVYLVVEDNILETREVNTGLSQDGKVEIISGLEEDDQVVIEGLEEVGPGDKVEKTEQIRLGEQ